MSETWDVETWMRFAPGILEVSRDGFDKRAEKAAKNHFPV